MERRIVGIVRWLDRCLKACKAGALESALMDAECARVDLERLRNEVWEKLERRHSTRIKLRTKIRTKMRGRASFFWVSAKAVLGASLIVLAGATPLFRENMAPARQEPVSLEWVTPDEKILLGNLRKHLSDNNPFASAQDAAPTRTSAQAQTPRREPLRPALKQQSKPADDGVIPYDRILSLVQAGEKAMQKDEPAIKIEKQTMRK